MKSFIVGLIIGIICALILGYFFRQKILVEYSTIENMYCSNNFCYTIEKADYQTEYCFSKTFYKTCLQRRDFTVLN